jgi:hypothetical protein
MHLSRYAEEEMHQQRDKLRISRDEGTCFEVSAYLYTLRDCTTFTCCRKQAQGVVSGL